MADKSWMKPGAECWVWGIAKPFRVRLLFWNNLGYWYVSVHSKGDVCDGTVDCDNIFRTEIEALQSRVEFNSGQVKLFRSRVDETLDVIEALEASTEKFRARIAELEANDG